MLIRLRGAVPPSPGGRAAGVRAVVSLVPSGARMLIVGVFLYTLMNLVFSLMLTGGVTAEAVGDKHYLVDGGRRRRRCRETSTTSTVASPSGCSPVTRSCSTSCR